MQELAVIYVPPGRKVEEGFAARFWYHCLNRGYELYGLYRDWAMVESTLKANEDIRIVVMPSPDGRDRCHRIDDGETVRLVPPPAGVLGETRRILNQPGPSPREIAAYQNGYAEGYVDCATVRQRGRNSRH